MSNATDDETGLSRGTLIRLIIVIGIGIPIVIEAVTFASLIDTKLLGNDDPGDSAAATATPVEERVGVGEELLAETDATETVSEATLVAAEDGWSFTYAVTVDNGGDGRHQLQIQSVETEAGSTVEDVHSTSVPPGESRTLTGTWRLPSGERPASLQVVAITEQPGNDTDRTVQRTVPIEPVPVQGQ